MNKLKKILENLLPKAMRRSTSSRGRSREPERRQTAPPGADQCQPTQRSRSGALNSRGKKPAYRSKYSKAKRTKIFLATKRRQIERRRLSRKRRSEVREGYGLALSNLFAGSGSRLDISPKGSILSEVSVDDDSDHNSNLNFISNCDSLPILPLLEDDSNESSHHSDVSRAQD